jgi:hypothetical protein
MEMPLVIVVSSDAIITLTKFLAAFWHVWLLIFFFYSLQASHSMFFLKVKQQYHIPFIHLQ